MLGVVAVHALGDQDVAGLDVPVHQIVLVGGVERGRQLAGDAQRGRRRERTLPVEQGAQVLPGDVAHGDVQDALGLAGLEDGHDVRVLDRGGHPGLLGEAAAEGVVAGVLGGEQFEGDGAAEAQVPGAVDDGHAAAAQLALHPVAGDLRPDQGGGLPHWPTHA